MISSLHFSENRGLHRKSAASRIRSRGSGRCLGILRLAKTYGDVRLEAARLRGLTIGARTDSSIASILRNGPDRAFHDEAVLEAEPLLHASVGGRRECFRVRGHAMELTQ